MSNPLRKIKTSTAYTVGFVYYTKQMAKAIRDLSGHLTEDNEYQVHYNAVVFRLGNTTDGIIDICIPTVIFNYPQEVTAASISFNLKDVSKMTKAVAILNELMIKTVISKFYEPLKKIADKLDTTIEIKSTHYNNIHKHPANMGSFSGTDYDTDITNPGIVYPLTTGNMSPIFSSILLHRDETKIAHSEYRLANRVKNTLTYYQGDCYQIVRGYKRSIPSLYKIFSSLSDKVPSDIPDSNIPLVKEVLEILESIEYEPRTDGIVANNVKKEPTVYNFDDFNYYNKPHKKYKKRIPIPHIGRLPSIDTFIDMFSIYENKIFTTKIGKFLTNDIKDFIEDVTTEYETMDEKFTYNDINTLLNEYDKLDILDMYIEPYKKSTKNNSSNKSTNYTIPLNKSKNKVKGNIL